MFVRLSLVYFLLGGLVGLHYLWAPGSLPDGADVLRLHGHLMMIGFLMMMVFGIALHVLPRFSGRALYSERLADLQFWAVNGGLWLMSLGWWFGEDWRDLIAMGGVMEVVGVGLFGFNLARTMMGVPTVERENLEGGGLDREEHKP